MFTSQVEVLTMHAIDVYCGLEKADPADESATFVVTSYAKLFKTVFCQEKFLLHKLRSSKVPSNSCDIGNSV